MELGTLLKSAKIEDQKTSKFQKIKLKKTSEKFKK